MPANYKIVSENWERYVYCRDNGHLDFINKARLCENYFAGYPDLHWDPQVAAELRRQRRPNLTINKVLSTISSIIGEQIDLRTETAFKAAWGATSDTADSLTKLFKHIATRNQLNWGRTEWFSDGAITSRGYLDVRMEFEHNALGDVTIDPLNPRNVMPDPDAWEYDPDRWNDVIITQWMTPVEIEYLYSNPRAAERLSGLTESVWEYGLDSLSMMEDRFGGTASAGWGSTNAEHGGDKTVTRMIRVVNRQHRKLDKKTYIVDMRTGDRKAAPDSWDRERIAFTVAQGNLAAGRPVFYAKDYPCKRIRWTVTAEDELLHDKWSPYKHFTVVPYFPIFRKGRTIGFVENLISPQDLLNKTTSQELHVINTTANSGWKVRQNALKNMTIDELEQHGARTGVVLELDDIAAAEKINPNQVPQGLDLLSRKAENYIKSISARGDAQMGMTRADVSADQIEANNAYGDVGLKPALDNLARSDHILARNVLDLVQEYYSDPRVMKVTNAGVAGDQVEVKINWPDPETGEVLNDVSLGEYEINVIAQPARQTLENVQFEQAVALRKELGVAIPDEFIIENSNLIGKTDIVKAMRENAKSAEAQLKKDLELTAAKLQLAEVKADTSKAEAQATLNRAKAASEMAELQGKPEEAEKARQEMALEAQKHEQEMAMKREAHELDMQIEREKAAAKLEEQKMLAREKQRLMQAEAILKQRQAKQPGGGAPAEQRAAA